MATLLNALPTDILTFLGQHIAFGTSRDASDCTAMGLRDLIFSAASCRSLWQFYTAQCERSIWQPIANLAEPSTTLRSKISSYYKLVLSQLDGLFSAPGDYLFGFSRHRSGSKYDMSTLNRFMAPSEAQELMGSDDSWSVEPCPHSASAPSVFHIHNKYDVQPYHFVFVSWLSARLRFGPVEWLYPPPKEYNCPYIGYAEGFICCDRYIQLCVCVNLAEQKTQWYAENRTLDLSSALGKYGLNDGDDTLTGDIDDDYHRDVLERARELVEATGKYDMEKSDFFVLWTGHNPFRAKLVLKEGVEPDGFEEYGGDLQLDVWISREVDAPQGLAAAVMYRCPFE